MQSRRGEARTSQTYRRSDRQGRKTSSCFNAIIFGVLLATFGCASTPKQQQKAHIESALDRLCLNGEGKGRLETRAEKLVFSYASKLTPELWHLGLSFPLHGEEDLKFKFATDEKGPTVASGPLVKRFEQGLGRARAHQLLKRLGKVMKGLKTARVECEESGECFVSAAEKIAVVQDGEKLELDFGSNPLVMRLVLPMPQSGAKWSLMWWDVGEKDPIKEQILLFPNDCKR